MSQELIYTSAPRGLRPASSGFCTVAATAGMSRQASMTLEQLSGYEFHFNLSHPNASLNPVNFAHTRVSVAGRSCSIISRIAFAGADYSNRTNKIAHHFLLDRQDQHAAGPAGLIQKMDSAGLFRKEWRQEPGELPVPDLGQLAAFEAAGPAPATAWQRATGDAGWGGALVRAFRTSPNVPAYVVFAPETELLPLFAECLALIPPGERWQITFATYYTAAPAGATCHWRGVLAGSAAAKEIGRYPNATVIDLTRPLSAPPEDAYAAAARNGQFAPGPAGQPAVAAERQEVVATGRQRVQMSARADGDAVAPVGLRVTQPLGDGPTIGGFAGRPRPSRLPVWGLAAVAAVLLLCNLFTLWMWHEDRREARYQQMKSENDLTKASAAVAELRQQLGAASAGLTPTQPDTIAAKDAAGPEPQPVPPAPPDIPPAKANGPPAATKPKNGDDPTAADPSPTNAEPKPAVPQPPAAQQDPTPRWLEKVEHPVQVSKSDWQAKKDGDEYIFTIPRHVGPKSGYGFVDVPEKLKGKVEYEFVAAERAVRVKVADVGGIGMAEIMTARFDHERNVIVLKPNPQAAEQYSRQLNSITIEAYIKDENGNASITHCSLAEPVGEKKIEIGFDDDWNRLPLPPREAINYAWPEALDFRQGENIKSAPQGVNIQPPDGFCNVAPRDWTPGNTNPTVIFMSKLVDDIASDSSKLKSHAANLDKRRKLQDELPDRLKAAAEKLRNAESELKGITHKDQEPRAKTRVDVARRNLANLQAQEKALPKEIEKLEASIRDINAALPRAMEGNKQPPVEVFDPSGRTIARFKVQFKSPETK